MDASAEAVAADAATDVATGVAGYVLTPFLTSMSSKDGT